MRAVPSRTTRAARVPFSGWLALGSAGLALLAPTPYILEGPGPAVDLLGEREGRPVLRVEGGEADPGEGTLAMTTVMVGGPPIGTTSLLDLGRGLTDPAVDVAPRELMYPTGVTSDEVGEANSAAMSDSQQTATAAALHELGREVPQRLVVQQLVPGGPAEGVLRAGDEVAPRTVYEALLEARSAVLELDGRPMPRPRRVRKPSRPSPLLEGAGR